MPVSQLFFWGIPIIALVSYILLIFSLIASKKDQHVHAFLPVLFALALWTGSSLLMKLQCFPSPLFWNKMMLVGLFSVPFFIYRFMAQFTNTRNTMETVLLGLLTILQIGLNLLGYVVVDAKMVITDVVITGTKTYNLIEFHYNLGWAAPLIYSLMFCLLLYIINRSRLTIKKGLVSKNQMMPLIWGVVIIFLGVLMNIVPSIGKYPFDILAGFINSILLMFAIYKYRLLELRFMVTKGLVLSTFISIITIGYISIVLLVEQALNAMYGHPIPYFSTFFSLILALLFQPLYRLCKTVVDKLFYRAEYTQRMALQNFSVNISDKLNLNEISIELLNAVQKGIRCQKAYLMLQDEESRKYYTFSTTSQLDMLDIIIEPDTPLLHWFTKNNRCLTIEQLFSYPYFKSMWDIEKRSFKEKGIEVIVPIQCRGDLIGLLLLTYKENNLAYTSEDLDLLTSLGASTAVAIDNARLYSKAQQEAITDSLTKAYNHRYFNRELTTTLNSIGNTNVSLLMCDLDLFKLYNDLHGHVEGDHALETVAAIMKRLVGQKGIVCRYGGEEFAILLPHTDSKQAFDLAEKIRLGVEREFLSNVDTTKRFLTLSIGLCTYPHTASNKDELLNRADIALYSAKNSGKNQTIIYSSNVTLNNIPAPEDLILRREVVLEDDSKPAVQLGSISSATTVYALTAAIDAKDHFTFSHSQKVAEYASILAEALNMDQTHINIIREAALLHDIGKIGIPEYVLTKPDPLTEEEYGIIKSHVEQSITIIKYLPSLNYVIPAVIGHHERWDGKGYPRGLKGQEIPIAARCLCITDAFDAMTSERHYKKPMPLEHAIEELKRNRGTQFDPELVDLFVSLIEQDKIDVEKIQHLTEVPNSITT